VGPRPAIVHRLKRFAQRVRSGFGVPQEKQLRHGANRDELLVFLLLNSAGKKRL
jgi:hypothetical protein